MRLKRRLLIIGLGLLGLALFAIALSPLILPTAFRTWSRRVASREGLTLEMEQIEAPLLKPVVVKNIRLSTAPGAAFRIECTATRLALDLNLYGAVSGSRRSLRA